VSALNLCTGRTHRDDADPVSPGVGAASDLFPSHHLLTGEMLDSRVQKILVMIASGETLPIRSLALEFNLSSSYLPRLFKQQTGVAMGKWLSECRLQRAAQLLANGYMSVKEIAHSVGYGHASSFIRAFERLFARAPARYRRRIDHPKW
jgi:AraC-like DNA-binding protein